MALRHQALRGRQTEVWHCPASRIHAGAACYALLSEPAEIGWKNAQSGETEAWVSRYGIMTPIEEELREAEDAVKHCRRHAERHRVEAERRERIGHDASAARKLVRTFQWLQVEHQAHRDRVLAEFLQSERISP